MQLTNNDLQILSQYAITAAQKAGQLITEYSDREVAVKNKTVGTSLASQVVTEVDLKSQEIILKILTPTIKQYDLALLTEESADDLSRLEKDFFWCIDPLDGTLPFVESASGYAVSIALVSRSGTPYIGVIYDPVEQILYQAIKGNSAFRNGKRWKVKPALTTTEQPLTFITDRSFSRDLLFNTTIAKLQIIASTTGLTGLNKIQHGGAAMNACWVLENQPACYFKFPKPQDGGGCLWDYAASACLFREAGACASDIYGNPLDLNRADSCFMNHRGVIYASNQDLAKQIIQIYKDYQIK